MDRSTDTNAAIWNSEEVVQFWTAKTDERERKRVAHRRFMGEPLPFGEQDAFTFLDLGAGTGAAASGILGLYPRSTAILADFSPQMMGEGERELQPFAGATGTSSSGRRYRSWRCPARTRQRTPFGSAGPQPTHQPRSGLCVLRRPPAREH
jgi:hypothetical protein